MHNGKTNVKDKSDVFVFGNELTHYGSMGEILPGVPVIVLEAVVLSSSLRVKRVVHFGAVWSMFELQMRN